MEGFKFYPNKNKNKRKQTKQNNMLTLQNVQTDEPAAVVSLNDVQRYKFVSRPDPPLAHQMYRYFWFLLCK
jgi:hypothetical protein